MKPIVALMLVLGLAGLDCSSGGTGTPDAALDDGGLEDAADGGGTDGAGDLSGDGSNPGDIDLGDDFGLFIPAAAQACTLAAVNSVSLPAAFSGKARVTFKPGVTRLFKDLESFPADLIASVEMGPEARPAATTGPGTFTRSYSGTALRGMHTFAYSQAFAGSGYNGTITLLITFDVINGVPSTEIVTLDEIGSTGSRLSMGGQMTGPFGDESLSFISCAMTRYNCKVHEVQMEGGDRLTFEHCLLLCSDLLCKHSPCGLRRAELQRGAEVRDTSDPFKLAASMRHHDWGSDFVFKLDPPLGDEFGVYLGSQIEEDPYSFTTLFYLDAALATLRSKAITGHTTRASW